MKKLFSEWLDLGAPTVQVDGLKVEDLGFFSPVLTLTLTNSRRWSTSWRGSMPKVDVRRIMLPKPLLALSDSEREALMAMARAVAMCVCVCVCVCWIFGGKWHL